MKKIILIAALFRIVISNGQFVSDATIDTYINTYIVPNAVNAITATKMNTVLNYLCDSKLHKDSLITIQVTDTASSYHITSDPLQVIIFTDLSTGNDTLYLEDAYWQPNQMVYAIRADYSDTLVVTGSDSIYYDIGYNYYYLTDSIYSAAFVSNGADWYIINLENAGVSASYWDLAGSDITNNTGGDVGTSHNFEMPATAATTGQITQAGVPIFHTYKEAGAEYTENLFLGDSAGNFTGAQMYGNIGVGARSLHSLTEAYMNVGVGLEALYGLTTGKRNTVIGYQSGKLSTGGSDNVLIGYRAGYNELGDNKLYIANDSTSLGGFATRDGVLIFGDFDNNYINVYNKLAIGASKSPVHNLDVTGTSYFTGTTYHNASVSVNDSIYFVGEGVITGTGNADLDINIGSGNVIASGGLSMGDPSAWMDAYRKRPFYFTDCLFTNAIEPWAITALGNGTGSVSSVADIDHPGVLLITCPASSAPNSGYAYRFGASALYQAIPNSMSEVSISFAKLDSVVIQIGFHDAATAAPPTDGVYFYSNGDSLMYGATRSTSSESLTDTYFTMSLNTFYRLKIIVNTSANRINYYIYDDAGTQLWTDDLATNIPGAGKYVAHCVMVYKTSAGLSNLAYLDYMAVYLGNLTR